MNLDVSMLYVLSWCVFEINKCFLIMGQGPGLVPIEDKSSLSIQMNTLFVEDSGAYYIYATFSSKSRNLWWSGSKLSNCKI